MHNQLAPNESIHYRSTLDSPISEPHTDRTALQIARLQPFSPLIELIARMAQRDVTRVHNLASIILNVNTHDFGGVSDLNANGSPLQALICARKNRWSFRFIADPSSTCIDPIRRLHLSRNALAATLRIGGAHALRPSIECLLSQLLPKSDAALCSYPTGMMRLALALDAPGAAIYVGSNPQGDPWRDASNWASEAFADTNEVNALIATLESDCALLGIGIEGFDTENARAKIYWRLCRDRPLTAFKTKLFNSPFLAKFLLKIAGAGTMPVNALNFSASFPLRSGLLYDIKVDVAKRAFASTDALGIVNTFAHEAGLSPPPLNGLIDQMQQSDIAIACVGLGLDILGACRINTYLYQR